jgi:hypothetical protein
MDNITLAAAVIISRYAQHYIGSSCNNITICTKLHWQQLVYTLNRILNGALSNVSFCDVIFYCKRSDVFQSLKTLHVLQNPDILYLVFAKK